jgi:hypothetical protein
MNCRRLMKCDRTPVQPTCRKSNVQQVNSTHRRCRVKQKTA